MTIDPVTSLHPMYTVPRCAGAEAREEHETGGGIVHRQGDGARQDQRPDSHRRTVRVAERGNSHCTRCTRNRVYETVRCPSVCPSVFPIRPLQQPAAGLLLWARQVGHIDRLLQQRRACGGRMRAVPRCERMHS